MSSAMQSFSSTTLSPNSDPLSLSLIVKQDHITSHHIVFLVCFFFFFFLLFLGLAFAGTGNAAKVQTNQDGDARKGEEGDDAGKDKRVTGERANTNKGKEKRKEKKERSLEGETRSKASAAAAVVAVDAAAAVDRVGDRGRGQRRGVLGEGMGELGVRVVETLEGGGRGGTGNGGDERGRIVGTVGIVIGVC